MRWLRRFHLGLLAIVSVACSSASTPTEPVVGASSGNAGAFSGSSSSGSPTSLNPGSTGAAGSSGASSSGTTLSTSSMTGAAGTASGGSGGIGSVSSGSAMMSSRDGAAAEASLEGEGGAEADGPAASAPFPSGMSGGCGMPPPMAVQGGGNKQQTVTVPSCGTGPITPHCVSPAFSPGGADYLKVGNWDFNNRNYGVQLPNNYDPMTAYPVILEGGGCTAGPTSKGGGFSAGEGGSAIRIGLSYVGVCFADGGVGGNNGQGCAVDEAHIMDCINTPEVPYVNAVLDYVESILCVDLGKIYIGGLSSGAWESSTVSCALANRIRGMTTVAGGLRINRPACTGKTAAYMIVDENDNDNPIGPMMENTPYPPSGLSATQVNQTIQYLDSYGSAPMRDELLARNECQGTATTMLAGFPQCSFYTGCPAAYPVVWCYMPGEGHGGSDYQNVNYGPEAWPFLTGLPAP